MKEISYKLIIKDGLWVHESLLYSLLLYIIENFHAPKLKDKSKESQTPGFGRAQDRDEICISIRLGEEGKSLEVPFREGPRILLGECVSRMS